jgi:DNA-binding response OmpR family regulator
VLIVSTDPDVLDVYGLSLRSDRWSVLTVATVDQAARLLRERAVSAVVLDVSAPTTDWDACRQLVEHGGDGLPVVVLTGWIDQDSRDQAFAIGCAAFIAKPATPELVRDILQRTQAGDRGIVAVE